MKLTVANLSSNTLAVPSPLNVTLTGGKSVIVVLKDADWKAAQASEPIRRLLSAKMLALSPLDAEAPAASAPAKAEPPRAAPKAPEPEPAPVAEAPVAEPEAPPAASEEAPAEDDKKSKKKKAKEAKGW